MKYYKYVLSLSALAILAAAFFSCSKNEAIETVIERAKNASEKGKAAIEYPWNNSTFPPEIIPPTVLWKDSTEGVNRWAAFIEVEGKIIARSGELKKRKWKIDSADWERAKAATLEKTGIIKVAGYRLTRGEEDSPKILSVAEASFKTSKDSVGAPIFYRTVTLPFGYAVDHLSTISWRLGDISKNQAPKIVLSNLPVCGNCHSFSSDGKYMGMDVDYGNDKGSYFIGAIKKKIDMDLESIITWSDYKREDGEQTFGLLSRMSPDGRYVLSTVKDRSIFVRKNDLYYSQLFFPIKGILAFYDRKTKKFASLPGADDPKYCQSNPVWSPDGKYVLFARAPYYRKPVIEKMKEAVIPTEYAREFIEGKTDYKYDIYRIPFDGGKGGKAEPLPGASNNGKSNYFPKYSPDGKWIVFTQAENFMLLQPDAKLYIMPAEGGKPRLMNCNFPNSMNSWHTWSPNGKWLAFSSKARGPYTQLYLTHIDENGNDSPPIFLEKLSVKNYAVNIPEFVNIKYDDMDVINEAFMNADIYSFYRGKEKLNKGDLPGALEDVNKSIKVDPNDPVAYNMRALIEIDMGNYDAAMRDFSKVIELMPERFDSWANRGALKFKLGDFKGAIKDFDKSLALNPRNSRSLYSRAAAKYNSGDYAGAVKDYGLAIKYSSKNGRAYYERAIALMALDRFKEAKKDLEKALSLGVKEARKYLDKLKDLN